MTSRNDYSSITNSRLQYEDQLVYVRRTYEVTNKTSVRDTQLRVTLGVLMYDTE